MSITERYHSPSDLPGRLPMFPLRGVILLPRATLPLNIFEPRYLEMINDALAGDRMIGVLQPSPSRGPGQAPGQAMDDDDEDTSPPGKAVPLRRIGCAGRITAFQETDDDRIILTLTGISRFEIVSEEPTPKPYRICRLRFEAFASDLVANHGDDAVDRETLLRVLKSYLEANALRADWKAINRAGNEFLVNTLSVISPYGPEEKQALLEAANLKTRAEVLVALAEMELASRDDGSGSALQ